MFLGIVYEGNVLPLRQMFLRGNGVPFVLSSCDVKVIDENGNDMLPWTAMTNETGGYIWRYKYTIPPFNNGYYDVLYRGFKGTKYHYFMDRFQKNNITASITSTDINSIITGVWTEQLTTAMYNTGLMAGKLVRELKFTVDMLGCLLND